MSVDVDIKKLLDLLDNSQGRFVPIANGEFLALTEKFRNFFSGIKSFSTNTSFNFVN